VRQGQPLEAKEVLSVLGGVKADSLSDLLNLTIYQSFTGAADNCQLSASSFCQFLPPV